MMIIRVPTMLVTAALAATPLAAQAEPVDTIPTYSIEGVTVTTTRTAVDRARIPQKVEVVSASDLDRSAARNAAEALRSTTPVDLIEFPGLLAGVSIRGFRPQFSGLNPRTLILLDGRRVETNNLAFLHTGSVERIEVLRGPASALYGPGAMGGVINLITRRSAGAAGGTASLGYGSYGGYEGQMNLGGALPGPFDFDVAVSGLGQTSGYRTGRTRTFAPDSLVKTLPDGSVTRLPWTSADSVVDFSEFRSLSASLRLGYTVADGWRIDVRGESYRADDVENPGDLNVTDYDSRSLKDARRRSLDLSLSGSAGRHVPTLRLFTTSETVDYYNVPEPPHFVSSRTPTRAYGAQAQDAVSIGRGTLVVGADYTAAEAESEAFTADGGAAAPFTPNSGIHSAAAFAEARFELFDERLFASVGARFDQLTFRVRETPNLGGFPPNTERYGVFTPSGGLRYTVVPGVQLYGNLGRGFVTPSAFNVAGYSEQRAGEADRSVLVTRGNPSLRPETSRSWDAGIAVLRPDAGIELDLTYFRSDVRDRIGTQLIPGSGTDLTAGGDTILSTTTYLNIDEAKIHGIEARLAYELAPRLGHAGSVRLFLNGTRILDAQEHFVESASSQRIRNVADLTLITGLDYDDFRRLSGRISGRYVGERVDTDYVAWWEPGEILYPAYLVFDLHTAVRIGGRYTIGLDLRNLTDEDYFEVRGYNLPGRSLRVSASATL